MLPKQPYKKAVHCTPHSYPPQYQIRAAPDSSTMASCTCPTILYTGTRVHLRYSTRVHRSDKVGQHAMRIRTEGPGECIARQGGGLTALTQSDRRSKGRCSSDAGDEVIACRVPLPREEADQWQRSEYRADRSIRMVYTTSGGRI